MWTTCAGSAGTGKTWAALGLPARQTLVRRRRRIAPTRLSDPAPEDRTHVKTGENSIPTNGEDSPAAHVHYFCVRPVLNTRNGVSGNPSSRDCERPARMVRPAEWNCARWVCRRVEPTRELLGDQPSAGGYAVNVEVGGSRAPDYTP